VNYTEIKTVDNYILVLGEDLPTFAEDIVGRELLGTADIEVVGGHFKRPK